jgi:death on curing protein
MRYITVSELIFINGRILNDPLIMSGKQKIRDIDLLLAAEQRPQSSAFGQDAYKTLAEKAAALLHSVARNHPFKDGNKRTALIAMLMMLQVNGQKPLWDREEALQRILDVAEGRQNSGLFAEWLHLVATEPLPEANVQQDTRLIDSLIDEHRWLLDELATR